MTIYDLLPNLDYRRFRPSSNGALVVQEGGNILTKIRFSYENRIINV
jgi:hypothetical protein